MLEGLTEQQIQTLEAELLALMPAEGSVGNVILAKRLADIGWSAGQYRAIRNRLIDRAVLAPGRGKGDSVRRLSGSAPTAAPGAGPVPAPATGVLRGCLRAAKPGVEDLQPLLAAVQAAIEGGRLRPDLADERAPLLVTPLVRQLMAPEPQAAGRDKTPLRTDFAHALAPALASGFPLAGVLAEPSLLLSSRRKDKEFRQRLLAEGRLLAVIALPPRLLRSSGMGLCLILLVAPRMAKDVLLLEAGAEDAGFFEPAAGHGRVHLCGLGRLATVLAKGTDAWWFTRLPAAAPGLQQSIHPGAYVRTPLEREVDEYFRANGELRLGEVCDVVPALPAARAGEPWVELQVVNAADVPALGLVQAASGQRRAPAAALQRRPERFLRAGDLLVSCSHTGGIRLGVVPEAAPAPGPGAWVAARTVWVYRPRAGSRCDAHALAMMLASPLGTHLLQQVRHGCAAITPRHLLELCLPAADEAGVREAAALFGRHQHYQQQIRDLARRQADLSQQFWPLPANPAETRNTP